MEYDLIEALGHETEMVAWINSSNYRSVELLKEDGSLDDLSSLCDGSKSDLLNWLSTYGLLGFRPNNALSHPDLIHLLLRGIHRVHGRENALFPTYEPMCLITEGLRVARAATALFEAIKMSDHQKRQKLLEKIVQINDKTYVGDEYEMIVLNVSIGLHRQPRNSIGWTKLAVEGLADITDNQLAGEFSLSWAEATGGLARSITPEWKCRSHLGALFFKMVHWLHQRRYCKACSTPLPIKARPQTKTCSERCRQQYSRNNHKLR